MENNFPADFTAATTRRRHESRPKYVEAAVKIRSSGFFCHQDFVQMVAQTSLLVSSSDCCLDLSALSTLFLDINKYRNNNTVLVIFWLRNVTNRWCRLRWPVHWMVESGCPKPLTFARIQGDLTSDDMRNIFWAPIFFEKFFLHLMRKVTNRWWVIGWEVGVLQLQVASDSLTSSVNSSRFGRLRL